MANSSLSENRLRVFLCHSSEDKPAVRKLYTKLIYEGFAPWFDEENLEPGQEWKLEISKAVRNSHVVIICLSKLSINKAGFVHREIRIALDVADEQPEGATFLIPVKLEECNVPERLRNWQWVNLFDDDGYRKLSTSLLNCASRLRLTVEAPITVIFEKEDIPKYQREEIIREERTVLGWILRDDKWREAVIHSHSGRLLHSVSSHHLCYDGQNVTGWLEINSTFNCKGTQA